LWPRKTTAPSLRSAASRRRGRSPTRCRCSWVAS
jgi:hypothetical protein